MIDNKPIVVSENPLPSQVASALRYILGSLGGYLVGSGYISEGTAAALATIVIWAAPLVYGQAKLWIKNRQLAAMANALPNSIARTK